MTKQYNPNFFLITKHPNIIHFNGTIETQDDFIIYSEIFYTIQQVKNRLKDFEQHNPETYYYIDPEIAINPVEY